MKEYKSPSEVSMRALSQLEDFWEFVVEGDFVIIIQQLLNFERKF